MNKKYVVAISHLRYNKQNKTKEINIIKQEYQSFLRTYNRYMHLYNLDVQNYPIELTKAHTPEEIKQICISKAETIAIHATFNKELMKYSLESINKVEHKIEDNRMWRGLARILLSLFIIGILYLVAKAYKQDKDLIK